MPNTVIVIPAYNEGKNIRKVVSRIKQLYSGCDIAVINDGSSDNTRVEAEAAGANVVNLPFNLGYGVALQTGYKYALEQGYEYLIQMDADGQHDPVSIQTLLDEIYRQEVDVVIGSRFLNSGPNAYKAPLMRKIGMKLFGAIASWSTGIKITDPTSGFQALNRKVVRFYASDVYPGDYPDADVIIMLHRTGFRLKEVPVKMYPKADKVSMHSGLKPVYYIFKMCLSILVTLMRRDVSPQE